MVCRLHPRQVQPKYTIPTLTEHTTHIALSIIPFEQVNSPRGPGPLSTALPPLILLPLPILSLSVTAKSVICQPSPLSLLFAYGKCHSAPSVYIK